MPGAELAEAPVKFMATECGHKIASFKVHPVCEIAIAPAVKDEHISDALRAWQVVAIFLISESFPVHCAAHITLHPDKIRIDLKGQMEESSEFRYREH